MLGESLLSVPRASRNIAIPKVPQPTSAPSALEGVLSRLERPRQKVNDIASGSRSPRRFARSIGSLRCSVLTARGIWTSDLADVVGLSFQVLLQQLADASGDPDEARRALQLRWLLRSWSRRHLPAQANGNCWQPRPLAGWRASRCRPEAEPGRSSLSDYRFEGVLRSPGARTSARIC